MKDYETAEQVNRYAQQHASTFYNRKSDAIGDGDILPRHMPTAEQTKEYISVSKSLHLYYEGRLHLTDKEAHKMRKTLEEYQNMELDMRDVVYEEDGKVGIKDLEGNILVPALFDAIPELYVNRHIDDGWGQLSWCYPVVKNGKHYLYMLPIRKNPEGGLLTKQEGYDRIYRYYGLRIAYFVCERNGKKGLLDPYMSRECIPCEMDEIYDSLDFDGCIPFKKDNKWGLYFGGAATAPIFDELNICSEEYARVRLANQWGWIDENAKFTTDQSAAFFGSWSNITK